MSARTIVHRTDTWPIVISTIFGKEHTEETLRDAYAKWTELMQQGPHVLIMDMTQGTAGATPAQRARVAAWIDQNEALFKAGRQVAHVMVIDSPVMRGIVTAMTWLRPSLNPQHVTRTLGEAVDRAVQCLREANVPVSADLIARAKRQADPLREGQG